MKILAFVQPFQVANELRARHPLPDVLKKEASSEFTLVSHQHSQLNCRLFQLNQDIFHFMLRSFQREREEAFGQSLPGLISPETRSETTGWTFDPVKNWIRENQPASVSCL